MVTLLLWCLLGFGKGVKGEREIGRDLEFSA